MRTARTSQILDANNNNISPATCVESLYFEMTNEGVTYRMGIRDRMLIAGADSLTTQPSDGELPYAYVSQISGANSVYQIKTGKFDYGSKMRQYASETFESEYLKVSTSTNFLHRNLTSNPNTIVGTIRYIENANDLNRQDAQSSLDINKDGLGWSDTQYIKKSGDYVKVVSGKVDISSGYVNIGSANNYVKIDDSSLIVTNSSIAVRSTGPADVSVAGSLNIKSNGLMTIGSNTETRVNGALFAVDAETSMRIYNKVFPTYPNSTTEVQYLTYVYSEDSASNPSIGLSWRPLQYTTISDGDTITNSSIVKFRTLSNGDDSISLIKSSDSQTPIYVKTINKIKLVSDDDSSNIDCLLINGKPAIGDKTSFNFVVNSSAFDNLSGSKIIKSYGTLGKFITSITDAGAGQLDIVTDNDVYVTNGQLYAKKVYMASDERLKTEIKDAPENVSLPGIKEFVWKDSSVKSYGVIAQELERIGLNELVDDNGEKKSVDYVPLLCLMIKNLQARVEELENKLS